MTVTPLGRDQDYSLKNSEPDVLTLLVPGSWRLEKTAPFGLYFIFPGICTLSLLEIELGALSMLDNYSTTELNAQALLPDLSVLLLEFFASFDID
ncbi:hypothetical protein STEG23_018097 [Scotinomys teguina]